MKPTQCLQKTIRRLPLSTKQAGREYYKGNRVGSMGTLDKHGRFRPDYTKIRTFVYPAKGTKGFELTPFVASRTAKNVQKRIDEWEAVPKAMTGQEYLERWKAHGGHDVVNVPAHDEPSHYSPAAQKQRANMPEVWEEAPKKSEKSFWQK